MKSLGPSGWVTFAGRTALGALGVAVLLVVVLRALGPPSDGVVGSLLVLVVWLAAAAGLAWAFGTLRGWFGS